MTYLRSAMNTKETPQTEPIPGKNMVENNAGGYVFAVDKWQRLNRFLILGSEGGSYYVNEQKLTKENANSVMECIKEDGKRVVDTVVSVSDAGRAPKNDPALFVLAMCSSFGDVETKRYAFQNLSKVARIGTHLFHYASYVDSMRGWGRGLRTAVSNWYLEKAPVNLAVDVTKYQSRDGWGHSDLIRLSHPKTGVPDYNTVFNYVRNGKLENTESGVYSFLEAVEKVKTVETVKEVVSLINNFRLQREHVPTKWLNDKKVWEAFLPNLGLTALIRNLGNLSKDKVLVQGAFDTVKFVTDRITDQENLRRARVHPLAILLAMKTYASGVGFRGNNTWDVVPDVVDALDDAFYKAFSNVEPTNKRVLIGLDVSGSMGIPIMNTNLSSREASAALSMVTYKTEPKVVVMAFQSNFVPVDFSRKSRLDDVVTSISNLPFGVTDCALPMLYASKNKLEIDTFIVLTDSETWAGRMHPVQALNQYRRETGINSKLIVVGMASNGFTIADPDDRGMLDVVGLDTSVPEVMKEFMLGNV